ERPRRVAPRSQASRAVRRRRVPEEAVHHEVAGLPEHEEVSPSRRPRGRLDAHGGPRGERGQHAVARNVERDGRGSLDQESLRLLDRGQGWLEKSQPPPGWRGGMTIRPGGGSTLT